MKKISNIVTEFWFATISSSILIAVSIQSALSTISIFLPQLMHNDTYGDVGLQGEYITSQLLTSFIGIVLGVALLTSRKSKK